MNLLPLVDSAKQRIESVLEEIDRLKQSDFPYPHPREALGLLEAYFMERLSALTKAEKGTASPAAARACGASLQDLVRCLPYLGFILRSTNVRNAFEGYSPLLRLACKVIGPGTRLVVSSEWEYSPYLIRGMEYLPGFVLIGLPASESSNPLLLPAAGHELGHAFWQQHNMAQAYSDQIKSFVVKRVLGERWKDYVLCFPRSQKTDLTDDSLFAPTTLILTYSWALCQAEEIFCDVFGLRIFGQSFLHSLAYLIFPGSSDYRSPLYPTLSTRVSYLKKASAEWGINVPEGFTPPSFASETVSTPPTTMFLLSLADEATAHVAPSLIALADKQVSERGISQVDRDSVLALCQDFRVRLAPPTRRFSLPEICNAGWTCALEPNLWAKVKQLKPGDKNRVLKDLMWKSMEVSEVLERIERPL